MEINSIKGKNILIVTQSFRNSDRNYYRGGVEVVIEQMLQQLARCNKVALLTQKEKKQSKELLAYESVDIKRIGNPLSTTHASIIRLLDVVNTKFEEIGVLLTHNAEIFIAGDFTSFLTVFMVASLRGRGCIFMWYDLLNVNWFKYFGVIGFFGWVTELLCVRFRVYHWTLTKYLKQILTSKGAEAVNISTISIHTISKKELINVPKQLQILMVGRLVPYKNFIKGVILFNQLLKALPGMHMVIVGSGPQKKAILDKIQELKLSNRVRLLENVSSESLEKIYRESAVFLHLSDIEGYCLVIDEALSYGCSVFAKRLPVYDEVFGDKINYIESENPTGLINYLKSLRE